MVKLIDTKPGKLKFVYEDADEIWKAFRRRTASTSARTATSSGWLNGSSSVLRDALRAGRTALAYLGTP